MSAQDQLSRLLALVPYLLARPGVALRDVAAAFDITEKQLRTELELLWVCGLPGHTPGDLIDMELEGDTVRLFEPAGVTRPLRLTQDEAIALVVALRALAETPGLAERDALDRALAKVEEAAGGAAGPADRVAVAVEGEERVLPVVQEGLARQRRLRLRYHPASADASDRDVDPMRVLIADGFSYLEGWCRRSEGVRLFRLDRVERVTVLEEPADPPATAVPRDLDEGLFQPSPDHQLVVLLLQPSARWVSEYYPCESVTELPDKRTRVALRTPDLRWVGRLLLGLGSQAEVADPAELAAAVRREAGRALLAYRQPAASE